MNKAFDNTISELEKSYGVISEQSEEMSPDEKNALVDQLEKATGVVSDVWGSFLGKDLKRILYLVNSRV